MLLLLISNVARRIFEWADRHLEERHVITDMRESWTGQTPRAVQFPANPIPAVRRRVHAQP